MMYYACAFIILVAVIVIIVTKIGEWIDNRKHEKEMEHIKDLKQRVDSHDIH